MKTNIDTIREELEWISNRYDDSASTAENSSRLYDVSCTARKLLAALSTIDSDAKPQEPIEDVATLVRGWWIEWMDSTGPDALHEVCALKLTALILAHDDAIRREERNRAEDVVCAYWPDEEFIRAAILGKEAERMTDISKLDVLYLDDDNYLSVQAMYPKKIVIPKSVYSHIADAIRRECSAKAIEWVADHFGVAFDGDELEAFILGTEPAREGS